MTRAIAVLALAFLLASPAGADDPSRWKSEVEKAAEMQRYLPCYSMSDGRCIEDVIREIEKKLAVPPDYWDLLILFDDIGKQSGTVTRFPSQAACRAAGVSAASEACGPIGPPPEWVQQEFRCGQSTRAPLGLFRAECVRGERDQ